MRKYQVVALVVLLFSVGTATSAYSKDKDKEIVGRMLTGKVLDRHDNPLPDAIVYLSNTRTRAVKSYITASDGAYHFPELSPNIDYEVYAQYKGQKSDTKTVSQFDDRKIVNIILRVATK
ncbi:MAG: carboxypeptidase-like regulatory domain-containing protein [Terriglobales bacterium]